MALIIEKAFDATKRIVRTVFKGSPNLFTTSDVNRQIESLKYQIDQLDGRIGVQSDLTIVCEECQNEQGCIDITLSSTYLEALGVSFQGLLSFPRVLQEIPFQYDTKLYLCLRYTTTELTYADDPSHLISGAKFSDGTSAPAANNIVVDSAFFDVSEQPTNEQDWGEFVVLASIVVLSEDDTFVIDKNYTYKGGPLLINQANKVESLSPASTPDISVGDTLTDVARKINDRPYRNMSNWVVSDRSGVSWMIRDNTLFVKVPALTNMDTAIMLNRAAVLPGTDFGTTFDPIAETIFNKLLWIYSSVSNFKQSWIYIGSIGATQVTGTGTGAITNIQGDCLPGCLDLVLCINDLSGDNPRTYGSLGVVPNGGYFFYEDSQQDLQHIAWTNLSELTLKLVSFRQVYAIPLSF